MSSAFWEYDLLQHTNMPPGNVLFSKQREKKKSYEKTYRYTMETMGKKYDKLELLDNEIKDERFLAGLLTTRSQACKVVQWEHAAALSENCHPVLFHGRRRSIIPC